MKEYRAIPEGYMTVGQLAKKSGTTVRTLQYYDKEGLLTPSSESEGGRRLYTDKDMIKLNQILSLKSLGFSLDDIKKRLIPLDSPADVANVLAGQADAIKRQIESLSVTLAEIEALKDEVLQMQTVDFKKYADIIINLQMKNENYWLIKYFDDKILNHCENSFDKESALEIIESYSRLNDEAVRFQNAGISPDSEEGYKFAEEFWGMIVKFTGGDMSLLPSLLEAAAHKNPNANPAQIQGDANDFIGKALEAYFAKSGENPFEGI
ncbi:MAG: MerR family transcriptional regulator [Lachnospiraceae bacterium]|nr:MerR family transcriptional regulator [Lachnospiraceae bacterium]